MSETGPEPLIARKLPSPQHAVTWEKVIVFLGIVIFFFIFINPNPTSVTWKSDTGGHNEGQLFNQVLWPFLMFVSLGIVAVSGKLHQIAIQFGFLLLACLGWFLVTTVFAIDPGISFRRLIFMVSVMVTCICIFGLMTDRQLLIVLLTLIVFETLLKFFFVAFVAQAIHRASDLVEPGLAGLWRGQYAHKNIAGAIAVAEIVILLGMRNILHLHYRLLLIGLELVFLIFSGAKTPTALMLLVLVLTDFLIRNKSPWLNLMTILGVLIVMNMITVGSILNETAALVAQKVVGDVSFTGRVEIWKVLISYIGDHPVFGSGFQSFWQIGPESPAKRMGGTWTANAFYGHQGFLDIAAGTGLPGLFLALAALIVPPLWNLNAIRDKASPMVRIFVGIWIFGLFENFTESLMFAKADPIWVLTIVGFVGLRKFRYEEFLKSHRQLSIPAVARPPMRTMSPLNQNAH